VPTHAGTVLAFDWRQAKELWRFTDTKLTQEIRTSPAIFGDLVFVTPRNKRVLALSKDKGTIAWEHVLRKRSDSSPVFADGRVWITTTDGLILALDEKTGEERWSDQRTGAFLAAPAIAQQKIVVANDKGVVYCFGAANL
jgi:outer membrane protein assembly factor BamB